MKAVIIGNDANDLIVYPDSAMGRDAMPLFLAEGEWAMSIGLAFRIGRLGKNVKEKFAMRYVDGIAPVACLKRPGAPIIPAMAVRDSAVVPGAFVACPENGEPLKLLFSLAERCHGKKQFQGLASAEGSEEVVWEVSADIQAADMTGAISAAISALTKISTIKTGDIIMPAQLQIAEYSIFPETILCAYLNSERLMRIKIK